MCDVLLISVVYNILYYVSCVHHVFRLTYLVLRFAGSGGDYTVCAHAVGLTTGDVVGPVTFLMVLDTMDLS